MRFSAIVILAVFLFIGCDSLKGPTGPDGPQGEKGEQGPQGETGAVGAKGDTIYTDVSYENNGSLLITDTFWSYDKHDSGWYDSDYVLISSGLVKNIGTTRLDYFTIYSKAYDSSGRLISVSSDWSSYYLEPGEEAWWKVEDYYCDQRPTTVTFGYSF